MGRGQQRFRRSRRRRRKKRRTRIGTTALETVGKKEENEKLGLNKVGKKREKR